MSAIGDLLVGLDRKIAEEASGFVVLVIDNDTAEGEPGVPVAVYGPEATPEAALLIAAEFDRCEHSGTHPADGSVGFTHLVLPLYEVPQ